MLDAVAISVGLVTVAVVGVLVWKTRAAQVWRDVAEGREQKIADLERRYAEMEQKVAALQAVVDHLSRENEKVILDAIASLERKHEKAEERSQARHQAEVALLGRMAERLEAGQGGQ